MDGKFLEQAKTLAHRPYSVTIGQDEATDGTPILLVSTDELMGCMAQGTTIEEALANLEDARADYIVSLLEDGLPIPEPVQIATTTSGGLEPYVVSYFEALPLEEPGFLEVLERVTEKQSRSTPYRVVLQT